MRKRLMRSLLLLLAAGVVLLGLALLPTMRPADPATSVKADAVKRGKPAWASPDFASVLRTAHAAETAGELDRVADQVYGQADFSTGTTPISATNSTLHQPRDIAVYDSGQVFVADTENNRVLGWNCIYSYENGDYADFVLGQPNFETTTALNPPTAASMNAPTGVAVGFDGFLYVSDTGNNRVLVFFPTNYDEYFNNEQVYYDPDDYYCEDEWWHPSDFYAPIYEDGQSADYALGQPDFTSGNALPTSIDTLASPMGLVTDSDDNLVVADHGNNRVLIYEWNEAGGIGPLANWVIGQEIGASDDETFSNNAAPDPPTRNSMNGPTDVAAGVLGDEVYVADTGNNRVIVFNDNPPDIIADKLFGQPNYTSNTPNNGGLSGSSLSAPMGVHVDAGNQLYVADTGNNRVLIFDQVHPDGVADEVFGQPDFTSSTANNGGISASSLYTPTGIATDIFYADAYIVDTGNNRALQYNQPLENPVPVIAELDPGSIRAGAESFTLGVWGTGIISDTVIQVNGITRTLGSDYLGYTEVTINASEVVTTGELVVSLRNPAPGGGVSAPVPLTIFVPTPGDDLADSVLGQKGFTTDDGPFAPVRADSLWNPAGVVVDPESGRLFVSDNGNTRVLSWPSQQAQEDGSPADLVFGKPDFTTYFYDAEAGRNLARPAGLALDSQGNLYVAEASANLVIIYTRPFTIGMAATFIIRTGLNNPLALALDSQDNLYVADTFNHRVLFYETPLAGRDGTPDRVFGQPNLSSTAPNAGGDIGPDTLHYPSGLALDSADNLYVSDSQNHRVLVYLDPANESSADIVFGQDGDFTTGTANKGGLSAESLNYPYGLGIDGGGSLWVVDSDNNRVLRFDEPLTSDQSADRVLGQGNSFTRAQSQSVGQSTLRRPLALAVSPNGDLFIADTDNSRVLGFLGVASSTVESKIYLPNLSR